MTCKECIENGNDYYYDDNGNEISLCPNCDDYTTEWEEDMRKG